MHDLLDAYDLDALERGRNWPKPLLISGRDGANLRPQLPAARRCLVALACAMFVLGYASEYADARAELLADLELSLATSPPFGCAAAGAQTWSDLRLGQKAWLALWPFGADSACSELSRARRRSAWPNAWLVLCGLLAKSLGNPLHLLLDGLGRGVHGLLRHHSSFMQLALLLGAVSALVGIVYSLAASCSTFAVAWSSRRELPTFAAQPPQPAKLRALARLKAAPKRAFRFRRKALTLPTHID